MTQQNRSGLTARFRPVILESQKGNKITCHPLWCKCLSAAISNSTTLFCKDGSLGSVKDLAAWLALADLLRNKTKLTGHHLYTGYRHNSALSASYCGSNCGRNVQMDLKLGKVGGGGGGGGGGKGAEREREKKKKRKAQVASDSSNLHSIIPSSVLLYVHSDRTDP